MDIRWKHPWTAVICGPTGCGKIFFVKNFFKYPSIQILSQSTVFASDPRAKLIVIDDLMREASNKNIVDLFTKGSHHKNLILIFITQNLFHQGYGQRDIPLSTNYIVVFENPRDCAQIQHLVCRRYRDSLMNLRGRKSRCSLI